MITSSITDMSLLSYKEIKHSMLFLSFFSHYTTPLYQFDNIDFIKDFLPVLLYTQWLVYKADFEIEYGQKDVKLFNQVHPWLDRKNILMDMLKHLDLYTPMAEKEANNLSEYWQLENQMMQGSEITHELLTKAIELRASDVLILHHICQKLTKKTLSQEIWEAIQTIEIIRDIEADLSQYEADMASDDFNIYCMFTKLYKTKARQLMQQELESRKTTYLDMIEKLPSHYNNIFKQLTTRYYTVRPPIQVPEIISSQTALIIE